MDFREVMLLEEVENTASHKQKELQIQKDDLEFSLNAVISTCSFAQTMLQEGSQVEISMGTPPVRAHLSTLQKASHALDPVYDASVHLVESGVKETMSHIREMGAIAVQDLSTEHSSILEASSILTNLLTNENLTFPVELVNKKKERVTGIQALDIVVSGPSWEKVGSSPSLSPF